MSQKKNFSPLTLGLAYFSMFFGSGNLVFPLFLGQFAKVDWMYAFLGFFLSGVAGPLMGSVTMVAFQGESYRFFNTIGPRLAKIFVTILMLVWIPFGAAPRCILVAYEALASMVPGVPLVLFGIVYSLFVYFSIVGRNRMIEVLGYFLTPTLLASLAVLWVVGMWNSEPPIAATETAGEVFRVSLSHGYQTMDLIASFFFSASIIHVIRSEGHSVGKSMKKAFISGSIGMGILGMVYLAIIYMAARHAPLLNALPKDQLLPFISQQFLGPNLSVVPVVVIFLACMTTSVAMLSVFTDFVRNSLPEKVGANHNIKQHIALSIGVVGTYFLSLFSFEGSMQLTGPILEVSCPLLALLAVYNLIKLAMGRSVTAESAPQA